MYLKETQNSILRAYPTVPGWGSLVVAVLGVGENTGRHAGSSLRFAQVPVSSCTNT